MYVRDSGTLPDVSVTVETPDIEAAKSFDLYAKAIFTELLELEPSGEFPTPETTVLQQAEYTIIWCLSAPPVSCAFMIGTTAPADADVSAATTNVPSSCRYQLEKLVSVIFATSAARVT